MNGVSGEVYFPLRERDTPMIQIAHTVVVLLIWFVMVASPFLIAMTVDLDAEETREE